MLGALAFHRIAAVESRIGNEAACQKNVDLDSEPYYIRRAMDGERLNALEMSAQMDRGCSTQKQTLAPVNHSANAQEPAESSGSTTPFTQEELEAIESKSTIPRFIFFPIGLFGLYFIKHPWPTDHWAVTALWMVYSGYIFFCWTSCFHETVHYTLTTRRGINLALGRLLGCIIGIPFTVYRESHIRHHAYLNTPQDWELWPYSDPQVSLGARRVFVWFDIAIGALLAPYIYGRIFFHRNSPITSPELRRTIRNEYIGVAMFWATILTLVGNFGSYRNFLLMWVAPHMIAGVFQTVRKLTEHLGQASLDPLQGTRTVIGETLFTRVSSFLNFNIFVHGPHHRHPRIAHDRLESKMQNYIAENPDRSYPVFSRYSAAVINMLPWLVKNPGVGVNVGANAAEAAIADTAANFESDVVESKENVSETIAVEMKTTGPSPSDPEELLSKAA